MHQLASPTRRFPREKALSVAACAALLAIVLNATGAPAPAQTFEVGLFIASAKEMAGVDRADELVRIPVVLESDGVDLAPLPSTTEIR